MKVKSWSDCWFIPQVSARPKPAGFTCSHSPGHRVPKIMGPGGLCSLKHLLGTGLGTTEQGASSLHRAHTCLPQGHSRQAWAKVSKAGSERRGGPVGPCVMAVASCVTSTPQRRAGGGHAIRARQEASVRWTCGLWGSLTSSAWRSSGWGGLTLGRSSAWAVTCIYKQLPLGPGASQGGQGASGQGLGKQALPRAGPPGPLPAPASPAGPPAEGVPCDP